MMYIFHFTCTYALTVFQGSLRLPITSFVSPSVSVSEHQSVHFISHFPLSVFFLSHSLSPLHVLCIIFVSQCCWLHSPVIALLCACVLCYCDLFLLCSTPVLCISLWFNCAFSGVVLSFATLGLVLSRTSAITLSVDWHLINWSAIACTIGITLKMSALCALFG